MNSNLLQLEIHAKALQADRMQRMLAAQDLRDANLQDIHPMGQMILAIRIAIGNALLGAGERISGQRQERETRLDAARRAPKTA